jgi:hypothetical protein
MGKLGSELLERIKYRCLFLAKQRIFTRVSPVPGIFTRSPIMLNIQENPGPSCDPTRWQFAIAISGWVRSLPVDSVSWGGWSLWLKSISPCDLNHITDASILASVSTRCKTRIRLLAANQRQRNRVSKLVVRKSWLNLRLLWPDYSQKFAKKRRNLIKSQYFLCQIFNIW